MSRNSCFSYQIKCYDTPVFPNRILIYLLFVYIYTHVSIYIYIYTWYHSCMISTDPLWNIRFLRTNADRHFFGWASVFFLPKLNVTKLLFILQNQMSRNPVFLIRILIYLFLYIYIYVHTYIWGLPPLDIYIYWGGRIDWGGDTSGYYTKPQKSIQSPDHYTKASSIAQRLVIYTKTYSITVRVYFSMIECLAPHHTVSAQGLSWSAKSEYRLNVIQCRHLRQLGA